MPIASAVHNSTLDNASHAVGSKIDRCSVQSSLVTNSLLTASTLRSCEIADAEIHQSEAYQCKVTEKSSVHNSVLVNTTLTGKCTVEAAELRNCSFKNKTVRPGIYICNQHQPGPEEGVKKAR